MEGACDGKPTIISPRLVPLGPIVEVKPVAPGGSVVMRVVNGGRGVNTSTVPGSVPDGAIVVVDVTVPL